MSISNGLSNGDYIGDHAIKLEPPEFFTYSTTPHLHLIGNAYSTSFPDHGIGQLQVVIGELNLSTATDDTFADKGRWFPSQGLNLIYLFLHMGSIERSAIISSVYASKPIRERHYVGVFGSSGAPFPIKLVGADTYTAGGVSMVPHLHGDHIFLSGACLSHAKGHFVCFTS